MATLSPLIICEHCDCVYEKVALAKHQKTLCTRCAGVLQRYNGLSVEQRLALTLTATVLWIFANFYPVMSISLQGLKSSATLWDSVVALAQGPITFIALVAAISIIIAPVFQLLLLIWVLGFAMKGQRSPAFKLCMRWLEALRPWSMLEVCLLGAMVAVFKLAGMLDVLPGTGLFALAALSLLLIRIAGRDIRDLELNLCLCHSCGQACDVSTAPDECERCGAPLHRRKVHSLTRTWAYMLTALAFYVPANLLPVMNTSMLGSGADSTIMSGVLEFWQHGAWDIALIIFIASIAVPGIKFVALTLLLVTVQRNNQWARKERSKLFRFVEVIGYWSMLDVIVVALVAALVRFQALGTIEPRLGILFFVSTRA
eukprot:gene13872-21245_t